MAITKNIFMYRAGSMATFNDRKKLQQKSLHPWRFLFPNYSAEVYVLDNVEIRNNIKLHAGLKITVVAEGICDESTARSLVELILNLCSFVAMAECGMAELISHIAISDDGKSVGTFQQQPEPDNTILIGTPRTINKDIFKSLWEVYFGPPEVVFPLSWFRKAIREKSLIDQFLYYFMALESANSGLRKVLKRIPGKKPLKWAPVKDIFDSSIDFEKVKDARNDIVHARRSITPEFIDRIRTYITPMRNAIVYLVFSTLGMDEVIANAITSNPTRILATVALTGLKGSFSNLPTDINKLLNDYPEVIVKGKPNKYSISNTGELSISFGTDSTFKLPPETIFHVDTSFIKSQ